MRKADRAAQVYRENLDLLPVYYDYVYSQTAGKIRHLRFGTRGWIDANGCGVVALHNVMKYIGRTQNFCDVIRDEILLGMTWIGGVFGTKPWSLGRYFTKYKIPYQKYKSPVDFKAALLTHKIGIVCTWNRPLNDGTHFYCVYYTSEENKYYVTNYRSTEKGFVEIPLDEISNFRFINGYIIY